MATYNLSITTDDPGELAAIVNGITGSAPAAETPTQPRRGRPPKEMPAPAAPAAAPPGLPDFSGTNAPPPVPAPAPTTTVAPAPAAPATIVTEADLITAANAAVVKIGGEGPAKLKGWLAANFKCADGSPGKLKQLAEDQKAGALSGLKAIAEGKLTI